MGETPKTIGVNFGRSVTMIAMALVLCLASIIPANAQKKPIALESDVELSPVSRSYYETVAKSYKSNVQEGHPEQALIDRNRLIYLAVDQMDLNFYEFQKSTRKKRALWQTVLDILEIGASVAISITNGERAKTLIAEGLGFVQASRTSINKNYALKDTQILFNKMVSRRAQVLALILTKTVQKVDQYPFEAALIDLISYYRAGTFDGALENLNIDTGAEAAEATKNLEELKIATQEELRSSITLDALLVDLFKKAKANDAAALKKLQEGLKKLRAQNIATDLIPTDTAVDALTVDQVDKLYADLRIRFVLNKDQRINLQKMADALK